MADERSEDDYVASEDDGESSIASQHEPLNDFAAQSRTTYHQPKSNQRSTTTYRSKDYRDLLNIDIEDVQGQSQSTGLGASQVGASRWTTPEKEALFQSLASRGPDNLQALARAVGTKSEQEVRVYLLLLQAGVAAQASETSSRAKQRALTHDEIPAAVEISAECEQILNLAADALAAHVEKHLFQQQHERFGDDCLVDADVAERMDSLQEQTQPETDVNAKDSVEADEAELKADFKDVHSEMSFHASFDSLLRPSAFLQLSRNIYMNNGEDESLSWHHLDPISTGSTEPALFRSALEDFRNIVVSITRRVVQATIFQATSRLRAEDASRKSWSPLGAIREVDVRTAVDLMNLPRDCKTYWAAATRRCRVGVFSDSKKYADGRPTTKSGHHLTHEEVETELGLRHVNQLADFQKSEDQSFDEDDFDESMDDSDMFTEEEPFSSASEAYREICDNTPKTASKKRKRNLSHSSCLRAENRRLEAIDEVASVQEERRLWELLRLDPPEYIKVNRKRSVDAKPVILPVDAGGDWRAQLNYESDWEQKDGVPAMKHFEHTDALGKVRKQKRGMRWEKSQQRSEMDPGEDDGMDDTVNDDKYNDDDEESETEGKPAPSSNNSDSDNRE